MSESESITSDISAIGDALSRILEPQVRQPSYFEQCKGAYAFLEARDTSLVMPRENQGRDGLYDR